MYGLALFGQDTLEVSKKYKTILIFPERVSESIIGNELSFLMKSPSQNGKYSGRILKLFYNDLSKERKDYTNLVVITQSGSAFEYTLKLVDKPKKTTWYVKQDSTTVNLEGGAVQGPIVDVPYESRIVQNKNHYYSEGRDTLALNGGDVVSIDSLDSASERKYKYDLLYKHNRKEYYRLRCYYMQFDKGKILRFYGKVGNVHLWLKGVYFNREELYVQFRIEKKESVDLDINFLRFSIATSYKKYSSFQDTELKPVFRYKVPKKVLGKTENHFVVVFKKFSLNKNKKLKVEMDEEFGNRNIELEIDDYKINNPIRF